MATRIKLLDLEREHILNTLRQCRGNRTHTARSLGISVRGLRIKLASYAEMGADVPPPAASIVALVKAVPRIAQGGGALNGPSGGQISTTMFAASSAYRSAFFMMRSSAVRSPKR